jgi:hypothetical protein
MMKLVGELEVRAGEIAKELEAAEVRKEASFVTVELNGSEKAKPKALDGEILTGPYKGTTLNRSRVLGDPKPRPAQTEGSFKNPEVQPKDDEETKAQPEAEPQEEALDPEADAEPPPSRALGPKMSKLVATMERHPPLSFFQYSRAPTGIVASLENAMIAIKAMKLDCRYDEFHDAVIVKGYENTASGDAMENLDNTLAKLRETVLRTWGFDPGKEYLADALKTECLDHVFDPVRDYLDSLRWDGKPRILWCLHE